MWSCPLFLNTSLIQMRFKEVLPRRAKRCPSAHFTLVTILGTGRHCCFVDGRTQAVSRSHTILGVCLSRCTRTRRLTGLSKQQRGLPVRFQVLSLDCGGHGCPEKHHQWFSVVFGLQWLWLTFIQGLCQPWCFVLEKSSPEDQLSKNASYLSSNRVGSCSRALHPTKSSTC